MKGRRPLEYKLKEADRGYLKEIVKDGQLIQRVANRARALLALDDGAVLHAGIVQQILSLITFSGSFPERVGNP